MKKCSICKVEKSFEEFNKNKSKKDGLQSHCRNCSKTHFKSYWEKNKVKHFSAVKKRKQLALLNIKNFSYNYLSQHGCIDCGEKEPACLDFDHVKGDKFMEVSMMVRNGYSISKVKKEIEKCEIRCANCHRKKTAKDFGWYRCLKIK